MDLTNLSIGGVSLIFLIIGTVQFVKEQGWVVTTPKLKLVALITGAFYASMYYMTIMYPGTIAQWITTGILVIAAGLSATGLFDAAKDVMSYGGSINSPPKQ